MTTCCFDFDALVCEFLQRSSLLPHKPTARLGRKPTKESDANKKADRFAYVSDVCEEVNTVSRMISISNSPMTNLKTLTDKRWTPIEAWKWRCHIKCCQVCLVHQLPDDSVQTRITIKA